MQDLYHQPFVEVQLTPFTEPLELHKPHCIQALRRQSRKLCRATKTQEFMAVYGSGPFRF